MRGAPGRGGLGGAEGTHIDRSIATVPAHPHPHRPRSRASSSVGSFTAAGRVYHSLVRTVGCGAVGLFSINYFRSQKPAHYCIVVFILQSPPWSF